MADKTIAERLQPSLLDRLTDDAPDQLTETRNDRVIDLRQLREILQRDLAWLLNTGNAGQVIDADRFPQAAASVLNYGISDVSGTYSTAQRAELIRRSIQNAVEAFEPRIHPGSLDVGLRVGGNIRASIIDFDIRADMWAQPMPIELYLRSQVDVTTGEVELERVA